MATVKRAIGIVRVSETKGREGESFASPGEQRDRIAAACERDGLTLIATYDELDVSGGLPLERRKGLQAAVLAVEAGQADVVAAAYFDRLFRSLTTQAEVIDRVERAGGQVIAVDVGRVTNGSAGQWLSGTMLGAVAEYYRRSIKERSGEAQARAIARGVLPWPNIPPGYARGKDGVLVPDKFAPVVAEAFRLRAHGVSIMQVRAFLASHGVKRSFNGVRALLTSRVVLGEIHFGDAINLHAHEPIVDREIWERVQRASSPRGRQVKSERLLARLGILRCGTCGARMVVGTANHGVYPIYRCVPTSDCPRRVTISATMIEDLVSETVKVALADEEGRASAEGHARAVEQELERAQADLDAAIRAFEGLEDESAVRERIADLRQVRDEARDRFDQLGGRDAALTVTAAADWDRLSLEARRALIRTTIESVTVSPGRGLDRVSVKLFGE